MTNKRISELDGLRGLAAICVLLFHYTSRFAEKFETDLIIRHFNFMYGNYGVELFFVISGFVIFMSIEKIKTPFEFVYKRFIRLYPTFWICMLITYFFVFFLSPLEVLKVSFDDFIINFTMLPSLFNVKAVDGVYWTLKVEVSFYILILILILIKKVRSIMGLGFLYVGFGMILIFFFRIPLNYYYGTLFLIGINFYQIWNGDNNFWCHIQIALCLFLSVFMLNKELVFVSSIVVVIFYLLIYNKLFFLSLSPFVYLGKISYALYLLHQYIGYVIQLKLIEAGIKNYIILILIPLAVSIFLATIVTFSIEKPLLIKLRKLNILENK